MSQKNFIQLNLVVKVVIIGLIFPKLVFGSWIDSVEVNPSFQLKQGYDDNITYTKDNKHTDAVNTQVLEVDIGQKMNEYQWEATGTIGQNVYFSESDFNNIFQQGAFNFSKEVSSYENFLITNNFIHSQEPRSFESSFGRDAGKYSYYWNVADIEYNRKMSQQAQTVFKYQNEVYDTSREDISGSVLHKGIIKINCDLSEKSRIFSEYFLANRKFDSNNSSWIHSVSSGFRRSILKQVVLTGIFGLDFIDDYNNDRFSEPYFSISLSRQIDERSQSQINFTKRHSSSAFNEDIFDSWRISVSGVRDVSKKLRVSMAGFIGNGEFDSLNIEEKLMGIEIEASYQLSKNIKAGLNYNFSNVESNDELRDYVKNGIFSSITLEF